MEYAQHQQPVDYNDRSSLAFLGITLILSAVSLFTELEEVIGLPVFILLIAATGLPHGATDHYLYAAGQKQQAKPYSERRFLLQYLLQLFLYGAIWLVLPIVSLALFLLISAYHFGQAQLFYIGLGRASKWLEVGLYLLWGSAVLALIIFLNGRDSWVILQALFQGHALEHWVRTALLQEGLRIAMVFAAVQGIAFLGLMLSQRLAWWRGLMELGALGSLFALSYWGNLYLSFAVFFGLWHAGKSIQELLRYYDQQFGRFDLRRFYQEAFKYSLISFAGIGLLIGISFYWDELLNPVLVFFIFISTVTLPHMRLIDRVYKH